MGVFTFLFKLPLAPIRGVITLAELIQDRVEHELHDASSVRRDLEAAEQARTRGEITGEEEEQVQREALQRMTGPRG